MPQFLWIPPNHQVKPPIETKQTLLPIGELPWPVTEQLFLRLLARVERVRNPRLFGTAGQRQDGIDVYARVHSALANDHPEAERPFVVLQSKRVQKLTNAAITKAVDKFLDGEWAERSQKFYYATSHSLNPTSLDSAVRTAEQRLGALGIEFVAWGLERISELLRSEPDLIDDFFSREWVRVVCGAEAADKLENRLSRDKADELRQELRLLYKSVFKTQDTGVANYDFNLTASNARDFIILDCVEMQTHSYSSTFAQQPEQRDEPGEPEPGPEFEELAEARTRRHRSARQIQSLMRTVSPAQERDTNHEHLDSWLTSGRLNLLVGEPGSGKSSFLRFVATDILSDAPQSHAIAQELGRSLPIWLPFAFLCSHLGEGGSRSVLSAVRAWLDRHDCGKIWALVKKAMNDDRLLLIVDGLDEWIDPQLAEVAFGQLETFLDHRHNVIAVSSTRPYALRFFALTLDWRYAQIAPLTSVQQREIVARVLSRVQDTVQDQHEPPPTERRITAQAENLLDELESVRQIASLARYPLFLVLLASVWRGEPLPTRRFDIYQCLITLLLVQHPQMRRRSSHIGRGDLSPESAQSVWGAIAFKLRRQNATGYVSRAEMVRLIVDALTDETLLGWSGTRACDAAERILTTAEQHLGLLVSHGSGSVGFLHRVLYEHLAGQHLATLALDDQIEVCKRIAADPGWRDVLLSSLSAQIRPTDTKLILNEIIDHASADPTHYRRSKELLAEAIACGVVISRRDLAPYINQLANDVEQSPWHHYRLNLLTSLTGALASPPARELLAPSFSRWMCARAANPSAALVALADQSKIDDDVVWTHLIWGLRHVNELVQLNASEALAKRFGPDPIRLSMIVELVNNSDSPQTVASIILAAGNGWPLQTQTTELIKWARRQQSLPVRIAGMLAHRQVTSALHDSPLTDHDSLLTDEEKSWLISLFNHNRNTGVWERLAHPLMPLAVSNESKIASECLRALAENDARSWDRQVAWLLARSVFKNDPRFLQWVITEFSKDFPLVAYLAPDMPKEWANEPAFRTAVYDYIIRQGSATSRTRQIYDLSALVPSAEIRDALITCLGASPPTWIARALLRDYPDDMKVMSALDERFAGTPIQAAKYSFVALEYMGVAKGFHFLYETLIECVTGSGREVATALSAAWVQCQDIAGGSSDPGSYSEEQVRQARNVLSSYDANSLVQICLQETSTPYGLNFSDDILRAWPQHPAVRERAQILLDSDETTPTAILRAYGSQWDVESLTLLNQAFGQLAYLEPSLRECIAIELGTHSHDPLTVAEVLLDEWHFDYDSTVSAISSATLANTFRRAAEVTNADSGSILLQQAIEKFFLQVETDLIAGGYNLQQRRRNAWIAMLITGNYNLLERAYKHRGMLNPARVHLRDHLGEADHLLVELIAQNWEELQDRCPTPIFDWFDHSLDDGDDNSARERVLWSSLATVAHLYPAIEELLLSAVSVDSKLRQDAYVVQWLAVQRRDSNALESLLETLLSRRMYYRPPEIDLIESIDWKIEADAVRAHILEASGRTLEISNGSEQDKLEKPPDTRESPRGHLLVLFAELYPQDPLTSAMYELLRSDLNQGRDTYSWTWPEVIALTISAARPEDLPTILVRMQSALVENGADRYQAGFIAAVSRRLRNDPDALAAIRTASVYGSQVPCATDTSLSRPRKFARYEGEELRHWTSYFFARLLDGCRLLGDGAKAVFRRSMALPAPLLIVHDPVLFEERLLNIALSDLFLPYEPYQQ